MKQVLLVAMMVTANVFAIERKDVMPLIEEASGKREAAYVEIRDKIVGYGTNALPLLAELAIDEALSWQQRLISRICYERIERIKDIKKLVETDWYAHPKFDNNWNMLLPGPEAKMHDMVEADLKTVGLWYYYLELEWKTTGELAEIRRGDHYRWASWCTRSVKDNPEERIWFLRICSELMTITPCPRWDDFLSPTLRREKKSDIEFLLEHRVPPPITSEPPFRLGTNIVKRAKQP